jgi:hypothetical protein
LLDFLISFTVTDFAGSGWFWDDSPATASSPEFGVASEVFADFLDVSVDQKAQEDPAAGSELSFGVAASSFDMTGTSVSVVSVAVDGAAVDHNPNHDDDLIEIGADCVSSASCASGGGTCGSSVGGAFGLCGLFSDMFWFCRVGLLSHPSSQPEEVTGLWELVCAVGSVTGLAGISSGAFVDLVMESEAADKEVSTLVVSLFKGLLPLNVPPIVTSRVSLLFPRYIEGGLLALGAWGFFGSNWFTTVEEAPFFDLSARIVSLATCVEAVLFRGQVPYQLLFSLTWMSLVSYVIGDQGFRGPKNEPG